MSRFINRLHQGPRWIAIIVVALVAGSVVGVAVYLKADFAPNRVEVVLFETPDQWRVNTRIRSPENSDAAGGSQQDILSIEAELVESRYATSPELLGYSVSPADGSEHAAFSSLWSLGVDSDDPMHWVFNAHADRFYLCGVQADSRWIVDWRSSVGLEDLPTAYSGCADVPRSHVNNELYFNMHTSLDQKEYETLMALVPLHTVKVGTDVGQLTRLEVDVRREVIVAHYHVPGAETASNQPIQLVDPLGIARHFRALDGEQPLRLDADAHPSEIVFTAPYRAPGYPTPETRVISVEKYAPYARSFTPDELLVAPFRFGSSQPVQPPLPIDEIHLVRRIGLLDTQLTVAVIPADGTLGAFSYRGLSLDAETRQEAGLVQMSIRSWRDLQDRVRRRWLPLRLALAAVAGLALSAALMAGAYLARRRHFQVPVSPEVVATLSFLSLAALPVAIPSLPVWLSALCVILAAVSTIGIRSTAPTCTLPHSEEASAALGSRTFSIIVVVFLALRLAPVLWYDTALPDEYLHTLAGTAFVETGELGWMYEYGPYRRGSYVSILAGIAVSTLGSDIRYAKLVPVFVGALSFGVLYLVARRVLRRRLSLVLFLLLFSTNLWTVFNHYYVRFYVFYELFLAVGLLLVLQISRALERLQLKRGALLCSALVLFCWLIARTSNDKGVYAVLFGIAAACAAAFLFTRPSGSETTGAPRWIHRILSAPPAWRAGSLVAVAAALFLAIGGPARAEWFFLTGQTNSNPGRVRYPELFFSIYAPLTAAFLGSIALALFRPPRSTAVRIVLSTGAALFAFHLLSADGLQIQRGLLYFVPLFLLAGVWLRDNVASSAHTGRIVPAAISLLLVVGVVAGYPQDWLRYGPHLPSELPSLPMGGVGRWVAREFPGRTVLDAAWGTHNPFLLAHGIDGVRKVSIDCYHLTTGHVSWRESRT